MKPLLQERTKKKVKVLSGCGRDELLKVFFSYYFEFTIHLRASAAVLSSRGIMCMGVKLGWLMGTFFVIDHLLFWLPK